MKKIIHNFISTVCVIAVLVGTFGGGFFYGKSKTPEPEVIVETVHDVIKIPTEVEKRVVTKEEVETKLFEIGELSTYAGQYTVNKAAEYTRFLLDEYAIPGTTNKIDITCSGIVKVGYVVDDIVVKVDNDSQTIYISLPQPRVNDNYVIWDTVDCREENTIFNPIGFDQYQVLVTEIETLGLEKVESEGIYEAAEENLKNIICNFLSGFEEFEIIFM